MLPKEIQSLQHPIVKTFFKLRTNRTFREEKKQIVLSGLKLLQETKEVEILFTKKDFSHPIKAKEIYFVTDQILKKVTGLENPGPIVGIAKKPEESTLTGKQKILALDQINDPGNLGTLIRTALALGWEGVFLTTSCVDPFNEKALRGSIDIHSKPSVKSGQ